MFIATFRTACKYSLCVQQHNSVHTPILCDSFHQSVPASSNFTFPFIISDQSARAHRFFTNIGTTPNCRCQKVNTLRTYNPGVNNDSMLCESLCSVQSLCSMHVFCCMFLPARKKENNYAQNLDIIRTVHFVIFVQQLHDMCQQLSVLCSIATCFVLYIYITLKKFLMYAKVIN
jgi:hypothetical protein